VIMVGMVNETKVPVGTPVFSRDGVELGTILEVSETHVVIGHQERAELRLPVNDIARISAGRLELRLDATDVRRPPVEAQQGGRGR
jgi:hypothetical protein